MKSIFAIFALISVLSCATNTTSQFSKIEYEAGACFGFCPIFKMQIHPDKTVVIDAEHFTFSDGKSKDEFSKPKEGTFSTTLKEADFKKLMILIDGLNVQGLKTDYGNHNVTDLPTSYLNITFKDGTSKKVKDYGKNGTPKLKELYNLLDSFPKSQTWTKVK